MATEKKASHDQTISVTTNVKGSTVLLNKFMLISTFMMELFYRLDACLTNTNDGISMIEKE